MINKKWDVVLEPEFKKDYFKKLGVFVKSEYSKKIIYPEYKNILFEKQKVPQDKYI